MPASASRQSAARSSAASTNGPSAWGPSTVVGLPRPCAGAGVSSSSRARRTRATNSVAPPLPMPSRCAAAALVMPGSDRTTPISCAAPNQRNCAACRESCAIAGSIPFEYTRATSIFWPVTLTADRATPQGLRKSLPGLLSLGLASCLAVTTEMLPVGLLPDIGATFAVPDSVTGLLVSLYAVMVATLAVPLTLATTRFARKPLLLATLLGYALSNALVAAAPVFGVVAAGRTVGGVTHALFFSLIIGYVPRLVARADVGRALALVGGGASAGFVVGVPLSTSLGTAAGWRVSFTVLAALSCLTFVLVSKLLPGVRTRTDRAHARPRAVARALAAVSVSNMLTFLGQFTVYTFISVLLLASGVSPAFVGPILLVCGACGLLGLWYVGRDLDRNPTTNRGADPGDAHRRRSSYSVGAGSPARARGARGAAVWNAAFGGVPSIYQACAVRTHAVSPEMAGAWTNATANVGIAGGAAIGAGLLQTTGLWSLPWAGACLATLGLAVVVLARKSISLAAPDGSARGVGFQRRAAALARRPPARSAISRWRRSGTDRTVGRWR